MITPIVEWLIQSGITLGIGLVIGATLTAGVMLVRRDHFLAEQMKAALTTVPQMAATRSVHRQDTQTPYWPQPGPQGPYSGSEDPSPPTWTGLEIS
jgi:hypothetical protein